MSFSDYVAQREEHAEQALLAADGAQLKADGTRVTFSREDHDSLHGWCLLPPLQSSPSPGS